MKGQTYKGKCFFFEGCASHPGRQGFYADGSADASADTANDGCLSSAARCGDGGACSVGDRDTKFSFVGMLGKITCMPTEDSLCVDMSELKFDDDESYVLVTFNDGRTTYPFRVTDLELHQPRHNYQLWWVQRTRYNFIIQKKKAIRVTEPTCTFDSVNDRYFPYTIIRPDGTYVDTL